MGEFKTTMSISELRQPNEASHAAEQAVVVGITDLCKPIKEC